MPAHSILRQRLLQRYSLHNRICHTLALLCWLEAGQRSRSAWSRCGGFKGWHRLQPCIGLGCKRCLLLLQQCLYLLLLRGEQLRLLLLLALGWLVHSHLIPAARGSGYTCG